MHSESYSTWFLSVCVCVYLAVCLCILLPPHKKPAKKRYKWVQRYTGLMINLAIKTLR